MYRFARVIFAGFIATVLVMGIAFTPTPAAAATTSSADKAALKEATIACKAEAKDKKIRWPASRKFVSTCVAKSIKLTPAEVQKIAVKQAIVACKAEAKGKKIRWPSSRKFVRGCISNALKDYSLDVDQLRRELNTDRFAVLHTHGNWLYAERFLLGTLKPNLPSAAAGVSVWKFHPVGPSVGSAQKESPVHSFFGALCIQYKAINPHLQCPSTLCAAHGPTNDRLDDYVFRCDGIDVGPVVI